MGLRALLMRAVGWGEIAPSTRRRTMIAAARVEATRAQWHAVEHREAMRYHHALEQMYLQRIERLEQDEREESQEAAEADALGGNETLPSTYAKGIVDVPLSTGHGNFLGPGFFGAGTSESRSDSNQDPNHGARST